MCFIDEPTLVTGSLSRGKMGARYGYCHCHRCGDFRVRVEDAHNAIEDFVRTLQIAPDVAALYRAVVRDISEKSKAQRLKKSKELEGELTSVEEKLFAADEALVEGRIARDSHQRMKKRYDREALRLRKNYQRCSTPTIHLPNA